MTSGYRVVVSQLGADPMQTIAEHTALEPMAAPEPSTLASHDVVVEIRSASVGWVDLLMLSGQYQHPAPPPYTPGLEFAGVVVAGVGAGDEVMSDGFVVGPRSHGAYRLAGGFATHAVVPSEALRPIPRGLTFDQACNLLGSYETAYHCLVTRGRLGAGETVLIHGASGATGLAAVHVAKLVGANVIATGRSPEKLAVVAQEGADHVVASTAFRDEVKALTGGRGVDVVYDGVGGDISLESLRCVRFGARYLIVGWAATPFVARGKGLRGAPNANQLPTNLIMMKGLDVLGCPTVIATVNDPALREPRIAQILAWAASGAIRPHVSRVFALADAAAALRAKWAGEVIGGCVLRP